MDQKLNEGPYISFLGKPAPTANFIAELCLRMNLAMNFYLRFMVRKNLNF